MGSAWLLWLSQAPLEFWPLAWIALIPLGLIVCQKDSPLGRRQWFSIWFAGFVYWGAIHYFVCIPHWAGIFGWLLMSSYLACYFPLFIWFGRSLHQRLRVPLFLVLPFGWVSVELIRAYMVTGLGTSMLAHSMVNFPIMIQTADIAGGYGTTFLIALVSGCLLDLLLEFKTKSKIIIASRVALVVATLGFMLGYGQFRLSQFAPLDTQPDESKSLKVAIIQGSIDTVFPKTIEEFETFYEQQIVQYQGLTHKAVTQKKHQVDLLIWPESIFPAEHLFLDQGTDSRATDPESTQAFRQVFRAIQSDEPYPFDPQSPVLNSGTGVPMLSGGHGYATDTDTEYNSVFYIDQNGDVQGLYNKNHLVMFGEYFPFGSYVPFVYDFMPIPAGLGQGEGPSMIEIDGIKFCPSVCFESTVGHLIRAHVNQLAQRDEEPDVLANITNDGWFYGTNCLDVHFACNVFRSVELRKQTIISANTGFSGHVDDAGRILQKGPRRKTDVLYVELKQRNKPHTSIYRSVGDWPAASCLLLCLIAVIVSFVKRPRPEPSD